MQNSPYLDRPKRPVEWAEYELARRAWRNAPHGQRKTRERAMVQAMTRLLRAENDGKA